MRRSQPVEARAATEGRILNISYNEPILRTRHAILEQAGFDVVSVLGFADAMTTCIAEDRGFDLVVIGPSLPTQDKTALIATIRETCSCRILSLRRPGSEPHPDADYSVDSGEGPEAVLHAINDILKSQRN